ncbi:hypothetical protein CDD82_1654 [Ophiocordyceps australis]|uniref:Uncharacterized protein n=1 Tax=Ophiocordyceps australis TaxID=1399860 RepID=A0A2C5XB55_9HYPO|nr:hypothetical protein CDD82_1654 [Ophiocordyceps australis]
MKLKSLTFCFLVGASVAIRGDDPMTMIKKQLIQSVNGHTQLGRDGVVRSFTSKKEIVDYMPFSPGQIRTFIDNHPGIPQNEKENFKASFANVDGYRVSVENMRNPSPDIAPPTQPHDGAASTSRVRRELPGDGSCYPAPCRALSDCFYFGGCSSCIVVNQDPGICI